MTTPRRETYDERDAKLQKALRMWRVVRTKSVTSESAQLRYVVAHYWSVENAGGHLMFYEVTAADRRIAVAVCAAGTWETIEETTPAKRREEQDRGYDHDANLEATRQEAAATTAIERRRPPTGEKIH